MPRPVALLDVSDNGSAMGLLKALKAQGIKDVYLFKDLTSFTESEVHTIRTFYTLVVKQGFKVHGVLTPLDITWEKSKAVDAEIIKYASKPQQEKDVIQYLQLNDRAFPNLNQLLTYKPQNRELGSAFYEVDSDYAMMNRFSNPISIYHKNRIASAAVDYLAEIHEYPNTLNLFFDFFLNNRPAWISSIVIAAHDQDTYGAFYEFKPVNPMPIPKISLISLTQFSTEHEKSLKEHLSNDECMRFYQEIEEKIKKLSKGIGLFERSQDHKIKTLEYLKERLINTELGPNQTINDDIITVWLQDTSKFKNNTGFFVSIETIIQTHNGLKKSETHKEGQELSGLMRWVNRKREEYGYWNPNCDFQHGVPQPSMDISTQSL